MGVDQAQIDKILSGASTEDPEVRLDNLEKELDFMKTSLKRLLIDIRERMNELDNPFSNTAFSRIPSAPMLPEGGREDEPEAWKEHEIEEHDADEPLGFDLANGFAGMQKEPVLSPPEAFGLPAGQFAPPAESAPKPPEKLKLQKVHQLFDWTHKSCKKFGHERFEMMIDAYLTMGYIAEGSADQIKEIIRMIPPTRGDLQEIGPNEFVSELYVLNRILDPGDSSLDRDMIEVLMVQRMQSGEKGRDGKVTPKDKYTGDEWLEMLDRI
ncbi:hypothetical protein ABH15_10950 [Methanoculleus taiwanensis]|uniref:Archaeal flagella protein FlaD/E domain-containing protein n=1 Tax=Methanoculleus taiwanensis TaxID=1550565 RepID=A0A498GZM7_9EURY|nr:hypothetical protein [Methanoculleus taiwanensis]RXE55290.1 hypothetical protein ABH15_10950 [Methanoculleus taiwanensis]